MHALLLLAVAAAVPEEAYDTCSAAASAISSTTTIYEVQTSWNGTANPCSNASIASPHYTYPSAYAG